MFGIIGGTGLDKIEGLTVEKYEPIETPYGETSEPLTFGSFGNQKIIFLARHGKNHSIPPHLINYQANIWGLHSAGVKNLIAINTVYPVRIDVIHFEEIFYADNARIKSTLECNK